jgi:hypothetical protein
MRYQIPANPQEIIALKKRPIEADLVVAAIAGVILMARSQGQSLEDVTAEVLADDTLLDQVQRRLLSDIVAKAWVSFN